MTAKAHLNQFSRLMVAAYAVVFAVIMIFIPLSYVSADPTSVPACSFTVASNYLDTVDSTIGTTSLAGMSATIVNRTVRALSERDLGQFLLIIDGGGNWNFVPQSDGSYSIDALNITSGTSIYKFAIDGSGNITPVSYGINPDRSYTDPEPIVGYGGVSCANATTDATVGTDINNTSSNPSTTSVSNDFPAADNNYSLPATFAGSLDAAILPGGSGESSVSVILQALKDDSPELLAVLAGAIGITLILRYFRGWLHGGFALPTGGKSLGGRNKAYSSFENDLENSHKYRGELKSDVYGYEGYLKDLAPGDPALSYDSYKAGNLGGDGGLHYDGDFQGIRDSNQRVIGEADSAIAENRKLLRRI